MAVGILDAETMMKELELFFELWEKEANRTIHLFRSLPEDQYDLRPDSSGRSLGELAWHLAEVDAYMSVAVEQGGHREGFRPQNIERPRTISGLVPAYLRVHEDAVGRLRALLDLDLDREIPVFAEPVSVRTVLWDLIISHAAHHRGQLSLLCRLAGGIPPELYGPTRETMEAVRSRLMGIHSGASPRRYAGDVDVSIAL